MRMRIVLEWFMNPDHLPFIYGIEKGIFERNGFEVELIEPKDHYDGFVDIQEGKAEIAITEPLHLVEHYQEGLLSLGCFFETNGGILFRKEALQKLTDGEKIRITTPASNDFTNTLAKELIKGYLRKTGYMPHIDVDIVNTDFYHIKHLKEGFDAAWLCFENFEGVEAEMEGINTRMISTEILNLPNVSALEMLTSKNLYIENPGMFRKFVRIVNESMADMLFHRNEVQSIYYKVSGEEESELMNRIIDSTLQKFQRIELGEHKWGPLYQWIHALGLTDMTPNQYKEMFNYEPEVAVAG